MIASCREREMSIVLYLLCPAVLERHRAFYFFGGGGLGTPVVSYAPLPMLSDVLSLVIIGAVWSAWFGC